MKLQKYSQIALRNPTGNLWLQRVEQVGWDGVATRLNTDVETAQKIFALCVYHLGFESGCDFWEKLKRLRTDVDTLVGRHERASVYPHELIIIDNWLEEIGNRIL